jgi:TonB family protein
MAAALDAAHREGIVHRDFKSPNVFVEDQAGVSRVVVTDFGLARALGSEVRLTQEQQQMMGTPGYMAPEQVMGRDAGPAADVWALGVVAFELVTGELPFTGESALAVALKRLNESPRSARKLVPELPLAWEQALNVALARDPEHRFPNAGQFIAALKGNAIARPRSPRAAVLGSVGVALLLAGGAAWWWSRAPVVSPAPSEQSPSTGVSAAGLRFTPTHKWALDVPVSEVPAADGGHSLGMVLVVARSGFLVGTIGAILGGIPTDADGPMDFTALRETFHKVKVAFPQETSLVVYCESGVDRATCDLSRITAAEHEGQALFPDQWLVEGPVPPKLLELGGQGFEVHFTTQGLMPVRRLTAEALERLKAKYNLDPLLQPCAQQGATNCAAKTDQAWCDDQDRFVACCGDGLVAVGHDGLCACPPGGVEVGTQVPGCPAARQTVRELLLEGMRTLLPSVKQCYVARLGKNAELRGKVVVAFRLAPDGRIFEVHQVSAELADPDVQFCVLQAFRQGRFSPPPGGRAQVTYPLIFKP